MSLIFFQHAAFPDLDASTSFFGVYDGHGGEFIVSELYVDALTYSHNSCFVQYFPCENNYFFFGSLVYSFLQVRWLPNSVLNTFISKCSSRKHIYPVILELQSRKVFLGYLIILFGISNFHLILRVQFKFFFIVCTFRLIPCFPYKVSAVQFYTEKV